MTTRKTLLVLFIDLALAAVARPALGTTDTVAVAVAARTPAGAPVAGFTLRFLQGDQELARCVTDAAGLCGVIVTYDLAKDGFVDATADGFIWGEMANSIDGGAFAPGARLPLNGDGVGVLDQSSGTVTAQGVAWTQRIAVFVDAKSKMISLNDDPAALPDPAAVFTAPTATVAPAAEVQPTATMPPVPSLTPNPAAEVQPAATPAPTAPPTPTSAASSNAPAVSAGLVLLILVAAGGWALWSRRNHKGGQR